LIKIDGGLNIRVSKAQRAETPGSSLQGKPGMLQSSKDDGNLKRHQAMKLKESYSLRFYFLSKKIVDATTWSLQSDLSKS